KTSYRVRRIRVGEAVEIGTDKSPLLVAELVIDSSQREVLPEFSRIDTSERQRRGNKGIAVLRVVFLREQEIGAVRHDRTRNRSAALRQLVTCMYSRERSIGLKLRRTP